MVKGKKFGVALSGGGYRAAAYHLGTLRTLNRLGLLHGVDVFSTVSGGSIIGADYVLQYKDNKEYATFEQHHIKKLQQSVIGKLLTSFRFILVLGGIVLWLGLTVCLVCCSDYPCLGLILLISGLVALVMFQFSILPVSKLIEEIYDRIFFKHKKLSDFPEAPVIVINSTNLQTSRLFTFSKMHMGDSFYEYPQKENDATFKPVFFKPDAFPIARSVMASSCVPVAFIPVEMDTEFYKNPEDAKRVHPVLIDGGVYDNQGIHKLTAEKGRNICDIVIVSDAGNKMAFEGLYNNVLTVLYRSMDIFMNRIKNFQMTDKLFHNVRLYKREIAYLSLGWNLDECIDRFADNIDEGLILPDVIAAHKIPAEFLSPFNKPAIVAYLKTSTGYASIAARQDGKVEIARKVGTNLTSLPDEQIYALINHAELMTELQIKLHCPSLWP